MQDAAGLPQESRVLEGELGGHRANAGARVELPEERLTDRRVDEEVVRAVVCERAGGEIPGQTEHEARVLLLHLGGERRRRREQRGAIGDRHLAVLLLEERRARPSVRRYERQLVEPHARLTVEEERRTTVGQRVVLDDEAGARDLGDRRVAVRVGAPWVRDERDGEPLVGSEAVADEGAVARLEDVERQERVRKEHHLGEREERQLFERSLDSARGFRTPWAASLARHGRAARESHGPKTSMALPFMASGASSAA